MNRYTPTKEDILLLKREDIMVMNIIPLQETCLELFDENKQKDKEIERLNNIIEIKNKRIQQLMKRTRSARINKALGYIENCVEIDIRYLHQILEGSDKK